MIEEILPRAKPLPPYVHQLVEWAARSVVWGRLGVPVPASHATSIGACMRRNEIVDAHKEWLARLRYMGVG